MITPYSHLGWRPSIMSLQSRSELLGLNSINTTLHSHTYWIALYDLVVDYILIGYKPSEVIMSEQQLRRTEQWLVSLLDGLGQAKVWHDCGMNGQWFHDLHTDAKAFAHLKIRCEAALLIYDPITGEFKR